jgi:hypothetical protein
MYGYRQFFFSIESYFYEMILFVTIISISLKQRIGHFCLPLRLKYKCLYRKFGAPLLYFYSLFACSLTLALPLRLVVLQRTSKSIRRDFSIFRLPSWPGSNHLPPPRVPSWVFSLVSIILSSSLNPPADLNLL